MTETRALIAQGGPGDVRADGFVWHAGKWRSPAAIERKRERDRVENMTPEQRERKRARDRERRANMTPEQRERKRERDRVENMTAEQLARKREWQREWQRERRANMTPDERGAQLVYMKGYRYAQRVLAGKE